MFTLTGVYAIVCLANGKAYVGSAVNVFGRWRSHRKGLAAGTAGNHKLRRAWAKYGESNFVFVLLEKVEKAKLLEREQFFIDAFLSVRNGYNCRPMAVSNLGAKLNPWSEAAKRRHSDTMKRVNANIPGPMPLGSKHSAEARIKMRTTKRAKARTRIEFGGRSMCLSDWADSAGVSVRALWNRLRAGWPLERALLEPSRGR